MHWADAKVSKHILFDICGLKLAADASAISTIHDYLPIQAVAGTVSWFLGLAVVNGRLIPVTDLGAFSGQHPSTGRTLQLRASIATVALKVDDVIGLHSTRPVRAPQVVRERMPSVAQRLMLSGQTVQSHDVDYEVIDMEALVESSFFKNVNGIIA